ncbi:MAG: ATP-dependent DNA helicase RecG [Oscillospiraceae bacterium]|nr:ATP-dependent DNA helicase RecG [Oscillospiraceae bacterium]
MRSSRSSTADSPCTIITSQRNNCAAARCEGCAQMSSDRLQDDIRYLKGVGEKRAELFKKLGVTTVGALLRYYPRGYVDYRTPYAVAQAPLGEACAVRATVFAKHAPLRIRGGKTLARVDAADETGALTLVYFNSQYAPAALREGETYTLYGKLSGTLLKREMANPVVVKPEEAGALVPQYALTAGLSSRAVAACVRAALALYGDDIPETLPAALRAQYKLMDKPQAVRCIHFPETPDIAKRAKDRLIFEELLTLQLGLRGLKQRKRAVTGARFASADPRAFLDTLPFAPTGAQRRCIDEMCADFMRPNPMRRLLQGDVGSGKTAVAAAGVWCAASNGYQSVFMAPTEILANQHARTLASLFAPHGLNVALLTGAVKGKARALLLEQVKSGAVDVLVGTHAVLGEAVEFANLGFVVADEQHRFGVEQRAALTRKGAYPHLLVMSATPSPRTLALIIYGDLDVSVLDEMPPGRTPVRTLLVSDALRARYLGFVREQTQAGRQAYIVCPLVEESEALENTRAATAYKEELEKDYLAGLRVGLLHGRMKSKEKAAVMAAFARGDTQVLVATTVIEVGVDVPNATLMIIENAERFGLSALHQLRGRVGRGAQQSWCVLVSSSGADAAQARLSVMTKTNDGFEIARQDLKARGPGDFLGSRQHGLPELSVADLAGDEQVLHTATAAANDLLEAGALSRPEYAPLRAAVEAMFRQSEGILN